MPFDAGVIAEIQAKVDLLEYVGQYVTLKRRGREYGGLCPFHAEKTPSFYVNAEKQMWHCHGCGAGGDLIKFVQRYESADFPAALRLLAGRAGVTLREAPDAQRRRSEREAIYEANAVAQRHFAAELRKSDAALDYLAGRGIEPRTAQTFGIGYAPESWESLHNALQRAGIPEAISAPAGLIRARPQYGSYYDFFRHRLMLPIFNLTGEVMAFGGRSLGDEEPKYLNTPNNAIYTKGQHVYGLHIARRAAAAQDALIVVEGYLDAVALHQAGFANTVASLGTAFTPEQARELRRVSPNAYLCFDGDAAGQAATARSIDMLVEEGLSVCIVRLPEGIDPDEFLQAQGADAFKPLIEAAVKWTDYKIDLACRRIESKFGTVLEAAREAVAVVNLVRDPIERDLYIKGMSKRLGVSEEALRKTPPRPAAGRTVAGRPVAGRPEVAQASPTATESLSVERELLQLVLAHPELLARTLAGVEPEQFTDAALKHVYAQLAQNQKAIEGGLNPISLFSDDPIGGELAGLALAAPSLRLEEEERRLERAIERFRRRKLERRLSDVDEELNRLISAGQRVPNSLRDEYNTLAASLRGPIKEERQET